MQYSFDYERKTHLECKNGIEKEVEMSMDISVAMIALGNKVIAKGVKASVAKK